MATKITLNEARSIADTSIRSRISDADLAIALFVINSRGAGIGTRDAARVPALQFETMERSRRVAQAGNGGAAWTA